MLIEAFAPGGFGSSGVGPGDGWAGLRADYGRNWRLRLRGLGSRAACIGRGMLEGDLKWGALRSAEAFVLPSHQENFGVAVVEALACGLPVLISDKVNIWPDIVEDGAGIVNSDTAAGTYQSLMTWLGLPVEERQRMASNGVTCFHKRYEMTPHGGGSAGALLAG